MLAKTIKRAGETYISTKDLKQILRERADFVTEGNFSDTKISATYKLALTSVIETLNLYEI